ncbi:transcription factor HIVEP3 [Neocloeon triangulifer]|uniref:transcription factor HIVEP3 n=1 Tax=Neocloeon triangulifer TaxID=2078957 RepID=UPI00286ED68D|nr:transcription factor HIVEP3 [Neocloeon triangulifer]
MAAVEREGRSVALETAYVHEVYDQISTHCPSYSAEGSEGSNGARIWPRVRQFLQDLEPGSLVCDVGCGSGKYLHINPDVFKIGVDRCARLTELAREKDHEVMVCDNLALPFKDDCFDAILSVAVVHHFATTERRVNALRELARVLRIGGRMLISVWAMEQRHRKFESQDVLVPWHRPQQQHLSTPSLELASTATTCTTTSEEGEAAGPPPYHAYTQTSDSDSARSVRAMSANQPRKRGRSRKGRSIDPGRPTSSSSDLSSPNETCYSFVRRALQKLAGGRRGGSRNRAWFLDSWTCSKDHENAEAFLADRRTAREDSLQDALDLPIELRRLEDVEPSLPTSIDKSSPDPPRRRRTLACGAPTPPKRLEPTSKSQSLGDILNTARPESLVRSRSSVARLPLAPASSADSESSTPPPPPPPAAASAPGHHHHHHHPPLVRQKRSLCEDDEDEAREAEDCPGPDPVRRADLKDMVKQLPEIKHPRRGVPKQRSLNDELMATHRQREKARVRQNITKQASLNEQLLGESRGRFGTLKDTLLASPRFQQLKSGITKLTTSMSTSPSDATKVASQSFKNGFVRILQGWKGDSAENGSHPSGPTITIPTTPQPPPTPPPVSPLRRVADEDNPPDGGRRHSREDNSDSSKDSSLQSDTSVDSEDSFASVIFIPKPEPKTDFSSPPDSKSPPCQTTSPPIILEPVPEIVPAEVKPEVPEPPVLKQTGTIKTETLRRIQLLLQQRTPQPVKPPSFPLVRRSSAHPVGQPTRPIPRLLSLELFNPETDDLDSDSSGVSSPDSVISVMEPNGRVSTGRNSPIELVIGEEMALAEAPKTASSLLEAAASVASTLEGAVDAVIQSSPRARKKLAALGLVSPPPVPPRPPDDDCRRHLTEFADKLSEKLLEEIDKYSESLQKEKLDKEQQLDAERYLQGLQEINSDIGHQLAKLNEDIECLQLESSKEQSKLQPGALKQVKQCSPSNSLTGPDPPTRQVSWEESIISSPELRREASKDSSGNEDSLRRKRKFLTRQQASSGWPELESLPPKVTKTESYETSLSGSTSQDSLQSSSAGSCAGPLGSGGALTFHRYYHVFKEGELDALIDRYVENLHIISSYYDHANWCIVAEKVQVWTI